MIRLTVLAVAGLLSVTASASNWVYLGQSQKGDTNVYVDTDSITGYANYATAFVTYNSNKVQKSMIGNYDTMMKLSQIDCTSQPRRHRTLSSIYRLNGSVINSFNIPTNWFVIYPDSLADLEAKIICAY